MHSPTCDVGDRYPSEFRIPCSVGGERWGVREDLGALRLGSTVTSVETFGSLVLKLYLEALLCPSTTL